MPLKKQRVAYDTNILQLDKELLIYILSFVSIRDLIHVSQSCKSLHQLFYHVDELKLWKDIGYQQWHLEDNLAVTRNFTSDGKLIINSSCTWRDYLVGCHFHSIPKVKLEHLKNNNALQKSFNNWMEKHSYAVVSLSSQQKETMKVLFGEAQLFFDSSLEEKRGTQKLFNEVGSNKGLVGFNIPSLAKEVYRIRRGSEQPWPQNRPKFKDAVLNAFDILEDLIETCLSSILSSSNVDLKKIQKLFGDNDPLQEGSFSSSPFDLFYYTNKKDIDARVVNCHEHVDPGWMTCVVAAPMYGLEVCDKEIDEWIQIEKFLNPLEDVVVFCDHCTELVTQKRYRGAIHRVTPAPQARLSLVYELRPKSGTHINLEKDFVLEPNTK